MQRGSSAGYEASSMSQIFNKKPSFVANYLALLLDATVATVGFPTRRCKDFHPRCWRTAITGEIAIGKSNFDRGMTRAIFKSAWSLQTATVRAGLVLVYIDLVGRCCRAALPFLRMWSSR